MYGYCHTRYSGSLCCIVFIALLSTLRDSRNLAQALKEREADRQKGQSDRQKGQSVRQTVHTPVLIGRLYTARSLKKWLASKASALLCSCSSRRPQRAWVRGILATLVFSSLLRARGQWPVRRGSGAAVCTALPSAARPAPSVAPSAIVLRAARASWPARSSYSPPPSLSTTPSGPPTNSVSWQSYVAIDTFFLSSFFVFCF